MDWICTVYCTYCLYLPDERRDVHHDAVSDDAHGGGIEHAGGEKVELERLVSHDDGVSRVRAPRHAGADGVLLGKHVHLRRPKDSIICLFFYV